MYDTLKKLKDGNKTADFLFPATPKIVKGKVGYLSEDMVIIDSKIAGDDMQFVSHPNNIVIIQKKA